MDLSDPSPMQQTRLMVVGILAASQLMPQIALANCEFLMPVGGDGNTTVKKRVQAKLASCLDTPTGIQILQLISHIAAISSFLQPTPPAMALIRYRPTLSSLMVATFR